MTTKTSTTTATGPKAAAAPHVARTRKAAATSHGTPAHAGRSGKPSATTKASRPGVRRSTANTGAAMTVTEETTTDVTGAASSAPVDVEIEVADSETTGSVHVVDEANRPEGDRPVATLADLDEAAVSADLVRVYLNEIGKVPLLTAVDEVELAKRIEAGLYAGHILAGGTLDTDEPTPLASDKLTPVAQARDAGGHGRRRAGEGPPAARQPAPGGVAWPSATPATACRSWTSSRRATSA